MEEFDYDAVIVGAGPIGGYLAQKLARNNLRVLSLEEHEEIGRPLQWFSRMTQGRFPNLLGPSEIAWLVIRSLKVRQTTFGVTGAIVRPPIHSP